jgi:hypothetical protein
LNPHIDQLSALLEIPSVQLALGWQAHVHAAVSSQAVKFCGVFGIGLPAKYLGDAVTAMG